METKIIGKELHHYESIDSTQSLMNTVLSKSNPQCGYVISADFQTDGRGRRGSKWTADPGKNVLMSIYLTPPYLNPSNCFLLNQLASISIVQMLEEYLPESSEPTVKWPNDVLINGQKIAGIIVGTSWKNTQCKHTIVGIGLNVNSSPDTSEYKSTSLSEHLTQDIHPIEVRDRLLEKLDINYRNLLDNWSDFSGKLEKAYDNKLYGLGLGCLIVSQTEKISGILLGIDGNGSVLLKADGEVRRFESGSLRF